MDFLAKLQLLYQSKVTLDAMSEDGIDVAEQLSDIEKKIAEARKMHDSLEVIEYYKRRKRWKSGNKLTDSEKDSIREKQRLNTATIAEEVFSE